MLKVRSKTSFAIPKRTPPVVYVGTEYSDKKALEWFRSRGIKITVKRLRKITCEELKEVLNRTERGFNEILKKSQFINKRQFNRLSFNEAVAWLLENTDLIRTPIIIDNKRVVIGMRDDEIEMFIPREQREREYRKLLEE